MLHTHLPASAIPVVAQAPRADAPTINWDNVAVETAVMLRLQDAPPVAGARASMREARDVAAASRRP